MFRLGILGSGKGSNFGAVLQAIRKGELRAEVGVAISDVEDAGILALARKVGVPAKFIDPHSGKARLSKEVERIFVEELRAARCDLVVLAGFMRLVGDELLDAFPGRIVNIHPSLLPKFRGLRAWEQALQAGERVTGCTVHWVDRGMDTGEVIARREVPILPGDTAESLHARIQEAEHELYPVVIHQIASTAFKR